LASLAYGQHAHATLLLFWHSCSYATLLLSASFAALAMVCSSRTACPRNRSHQWFTCVRLRYSHLTLCSAFSLTVQHPGFWPEHRRAVCNLCLHSDCEGSSASWRTPLSFIQHVKELHVIAKFRPSYFRTHSARAGDSRERGCERLLFTHSKIGVNGGILKPISNQGNSSYK